MALVTIYTLEVCPHCEQLKKFLDREHVVYTTMDMNSAAGKTELSFNGVFTIEAPVLQVGENFFTSDWIFPDGKLDEKEVRLLVDV